MVHRSTTSLAPGFRFHPTDEELVSYYLKNKILGKPLRWDAISEVDIYRFEPWDLPVQSKLKSRDLEWYFFSVLDRKYGNGSRTNRTTDRGYWKTTGKDRAVKRGSRTVGMKKTLVYHCGRAPRGERTNWVMHEYKMVEEEISKSSVVQGVFVVCRIFQKSGSGPKNGEQYGAPFVEEEWDDENVEAAIVPGIDLMNEVVPAAADGDLFVEADDFDQKLSMPIIPENSNPPSNFYHHTSHDLHDSQQPFHNGEEDGTGTDQAVTFSDCRGFVDFTPSEAHRNTFFGNIIDGKPAFFNPNECADEYTDLFLDEPYFDASDTSLMPSSASVSHFLHESKPAFASENYLDANDQLMLSQGLFLEENDLTNPIEPGSCSSIPTQFPFEDYLSYFDDNAFESSTLTLAENSTTDLKHSSKDSLNDGDNPTFTGCGGAPFSEPEAAECKPEQDLGRLRPLMKYATNILGSIDARPAYAAEQKEKDGVVHKSYTSFIVATSPSLATVCTTGVLMQIHESMGMKWRVGKNGCVNCVLSLGIPQDVCSFGCCGGHGSFSGKLISVIMVTALVLCAASKIGTCCC